MAAFLLHPIRRCRLVYLGRPSLLVSSWKNSANMVSNFFFLVSLLKILLCLIPGGSSSTDIVCGSRSLISFWDSSLSLRNESIVRFPAVFFYFGCEVIQAGLATVWSAFWEQGLLQRSLEICEVTEGWVGAEQKDICPGLEGFHASGRPDDLGPPGLPAGRGSQRVNLTQMDPHAIAEHTHGATHTCANQCEALKTDASVHIKE